MIRYSPAILVASFFVSGIAPAQTSVGGDGRLFDANPSVLGGPINAARPASPIMRGNMLGSGNVRFGQSLRTSTIGDPGVFSLGLPSSGLGGFVRDSFSVADAPRSQLGGFTPFYDPGQTAPTAAFLRQQGLYQDFNVPTRLSSGGLGGPRAPLPGQLDYSRALSPASPFDSGIAEIARRDRGGLGSSIFGADAQWGPREVSFEVDPGVREREPRRPFDPTPRIGDIDALLRDRGLERISTETESARADLDSIWGALDWSRPADLLSDRPVVGMPSPGLSSSLLSQRGRLDAEAARAQDVAPVVGLGTDLFTDMRIALELEQDPDATWFDEMRRVQAGSDQPREAMELATIAESSATEFMDNVLNAPIASFAREDYSALGQALREAESHLAERKFYVAARAYERAEQLDPVNPLATFGRAHALLAAGEYRSASVVLEQALQRFPEMARFRLDLKSMFGGGETIDIRRADLMDLLRRNETPEMRFLLGYLEWNSGLSDSGLDNIERAARAASPGSLIGRYPDMLGLRSTDNSGSEQGSSGE